MQELKMVLLVSVSGMVLGGVYLLWSVMPLIAIGSVLLLCTCALSVGVRVLSKQVSEVAAHWLVVSEKYYAVKKAKYIQFNPKHMIVQPVAGGFDIKYLPACAVSQVESPGDVLALPSPSVDMSPGALLSGVSDGSIVLGVSSRGPVIREWTKVKAILVLGLSGGGKTTTVVWLIIQVLLQGGRLAVIDKHAKTEDDSMYKKIRPFEGVFDVPIGESPQSAMRVIQHARKIYDSRLEGAKCAYPLLLIVDEFSAIMRQLKSEGKWHDVAVQLAALVEDFNYEGRKIRCFAICIGQAVNASRSGGTEIRDTFNTRIVHRMQEKQASTLGYADEKQSISQLQTGQVLIDCEGDEAFLMQVPYVDDAFIESVARSLGRPDGFQDAFTGLSGKVVESDVNGAETLVESHLDDFNDKLKRVAMLRRIGVVAKASIINEVWGVKPGGSQKYKQAECEYNEILGVLNAEG
jgi:hypothetical protein